MNGRPVDQATLQLSSLGQAVVRLTANLPVEGDFKGQLGLIVGGVRIPYEITITRRKPQNPPKVVIVGVGNDGRLAMTTDRAAFEWPIIVRRDDTLSSDINVAVRASTLSGPSGLVIQPTLIKDGRPAPASMKLAPLDQQPLALTGMADAEGTYTGEITLETGGVRSSVTLVLTRTHPDFDLKVDPISRLRSVGGDGVNLQISLQNPANTERTINLPIVARLNRVDASGSEPVEVGADGYQVSYALASGAPLPNPLRIAGNAGLDLQMTIKGINDPGNYKGIMRFTAPDRKLLDVNFDLAVRLWWGWAALAIGLGTIVAAVLRWYQQTAQPRLLLQRDALGLRSALTSLVQAEGHDLSAQEREVITSMIRELNEASDTLAAGTPIAVSTNEIESVRRRLPLLSPWIKARRRHDAIGPPTVAAAIKADLQLAYDTVRNPQSTDQQVQAALGALSGIDVKLVQAERTYITDSAGKITTAIEDFPAGEQPDFVPVAQLLVAAEKAAATEQMDTARAQLDEARLQFAEIAARHLRQTLAKAPVAVGFTPGPEWAAFVARTTRELDEVVTEHNPEHRVERWNEATRRYLTEVVQHAKSYIDMLLQDPVPDARDTLDKAATELSKALQALAANNLRAARQSYEAAIAAANQARRPLQTAGRLLGVAAAADANAPKAGAELPPSIIDEVVGSVLPLPLGQGVNVADVNRSLRKFHLVFGAVVLLIAVFSGLQLLYVPNPAFGRADLLVAFLWGAGLHAVAGQTFQGLQSLARQFQ